MKTFAALAMAFGAVSAAPANAAAVVRHVTISADNFARYGSPVTPPIETVTADFTISYDDEAIYERSPGQVIVNSINVPGISPDSFRLWSNPFFVQFAVVGGDLATSAFSFSFTNVRNLTYDSVVSYRIGPFADAFPFETTSVRVSGFDDLIYVPEPDTWGLLIAAFGFLGAVMRRRPPPQASTKRNAIA